MTERLLPTPSHTIGPFYGYALPFPEGGQVAPQGHPDAITLHGYVLDGAGEPIPEDITQTLYELGSNRMVKFHPYGQFIDNLS